MKSEECSGIDGWSAKSNFQVIKEERNGLYVCTISGYIGKDPQINDEGTWTCRMEELESTSFEHDLQHFNVTLLRPARVSTSIDHSVEGGDRQSSASAEMFETDEAEITCTAEEGLPQPKILWFLNNNLIEFEAREFRDRFKILNTEGPTNKRNGWYQQQRIKYTANKKDNEEILQCKVEQVDDQGSIVTTSNNGAKYRLYIKVTLHFILSVSTECIYYYIIYIIEYSHRAYSRRGNDWSNIWNYNHSYPRPSPARLCLSLKKVMLFQRRLSHTA